jgi:outer membrane protein OmpA-like peptidoglycan-associated protein
MERFSLKISTFFLIIAMVVMSTSGCSRAGKGGAIGAGAGGAVGAVVGSKYGSTIRGALIGAAIGGVAGALIGRYMDKQAAELKSELNGARVERVAEGIRVTFPSGILFDFDSAELRQASRDNLQSFAKTLNNYPNTNIRIEGHTDSVGKPDYNQKLSERRAQAVVDYLDGLGVDGSRLIPVGYGETQPVASNSTEAGRQQNRRVEIAIVADDKLKQQAQQAAKEGKKTL